MAIKHNSVSIILYLSVILVICFFTGCKKTPAGPKPPEVTITTPIQKDISEFHDYTGNTEATETVEVRARVEGFLEEIHFQDGGDVNEGDVLFSIEKETFQANVEQARATLESRTADLKRAQADFDRVSSAVKSGAVSEQEMDLKEAERDITKAAVSEAKAMLAQAQLQLDYTGVKSPISGTISRSFVDTGNLVGSGEKTLLARVVRFDPMYVYFNISETILIEHLKRVDQAKEKKKRTDVKFYISISEDDYSHEGTLDYISNQIDPQTGTIQVRGVVSNKRNLLYPGMFVKIRIFNPSETPALLIHEKAILTDLGGKYILRVGENNIVEKQYVKLGQLYDDMRVIKEGLGNNDNYIFKGLQRARPGLPVTPVSDKTSKQDENKP